MKKISVISLLLALVMCLSIVLVACEGDTEQPPVDQPPVDQPPVKEPATEAQRKDAVIAYMAAINAGTSEEIPTMPTPDSVIDAVAETVQGIQFSGKSTVDSPEEPAMEYTFAIKDSTFYMTEGTVKNYIFIDKDLNLISVEETDGEVPYVSTLPLFAEMPDLSEFAGMIPEDFEMPEIPAITAEDLIVKGERVSLSMEYIKEVITVVMGAAGTVMGIEPEDIPQFVASYVMMVNSMKIDLYFTVNDDAQITGCGVDFDIHEAAPLMNLQQFTFAASVAVDPTTRVPTATEIAFESDTAKIAFSASVVYASNQIVSSEMKSYISLPAAFDPDGEDATEGARNVTEFSIAFHPAGMMAESADILKAEMKGSYETADKTVTPVTTTTVSVVKEAGQLNIDMKTTERGAEDGTVKATVNLISPPIIPGISDEAKALKQKAEMQLSKMDEILADKAAIEAISIDAPMLEYLFYYDAATYTEYRVTFEEDEDGRGYHLEVEEYYFATAQTYTPTLIKNADGTFSIATAE